MQAIKRKSIFIKILFGVFHDDFGVDKNDALDYQNWHYGFADWWLLQHKRGYKPFETIVHLRATITATLQVLEE